MQQLTNQQLSQQLKSQQLSQQISQQLAQQLSSQQGCVMYINPPKYRIKKFGKKGKRGRNNNFPIQTKE